MTRIFSNWSQHSLLEMEEHGVQGARLFPAGFRHCFFMCILMPRGLGGTWFCVEKTNMARYSILNSYPSSDRFDTRRFTMENFPNSLLVCGWDSYYSPHNIHEKITGNKSWDRDVLMRMLCTWTLTLKPSNKNKTVQIPLYFLMKVNFQSMFF